MQIVFDFIAGDIPFDEFWDAYCADLKIGKWLDGIADFSQEPPPQICKDIMLLGIYRTVQSDYHGHISQFISADYAAMKNGLMDMNQRYYLFSLVETAVVAAFPHIKRTKRYKKDHEYLTKAMGQSIGGKEVADYAFAILKQFGETMKTIDRIKAGKEALWKAFHIKDRKFPRWAQEADWPMGKNSPMEYLGQRRDGELVELRFRDADTGEERTVEQFY